MPAAADDGAAFLEESGDEDESSDESGDPEIAPTGDAKVDLE